jgi:hypothetical protein
MGYTVSVSESCPTQRGCGAFDFVGEARNSAELALLDSGGLGGVVQVPVEWRPVNPTVMDNGAVLSARWDLWVLNQPAGVAVQTPWSITNDEGYKMSGAYLTSGFAVVLNQAMTPYQVIQFDSMDEFTYNVSLVRYSDGRTALEYGYEAPHRSGEYNFMAEVARICTDVQKIPGLWAVTVTTIEDNHLPTRPLLTEAQVRELGIAA